MNWESSLEKWAEHALMHYQPGVSHALLVDAVRAMRTADSTAVSALPELVSNTNHIFSGVVQAAGSLLLIINSHGLVQNLPQATPEPQAEKSSNAT